ncbi:hypothetical protein [Fimbriiglobus ruber]|uniref:Lipoprotein n=1 Tax=Fimbriiglobus ruber TaxID=1908690 RepID=A0A225DB61_9BACT|nr:hypothetical protein [Fimbriiglobus ruber]OWK38702.1 hypothetical protein FRUB_07822 [Fimbriiglobus ruber]
MNRAALLVVAILVGCDSVPKTRTTATTTTPEPPPVQATVRELTKNDIEDLTREFQKDAPMAKIRFATQRWRFQGHVKWTSDDGHIGVSIEDLGDVTLNLRRPATAKQLEKEKWYPFEATIVGFDRSTPGGISIVDTDLAGPAVNGPTDFGTRSLHQKGPQSGGSRNGPTGN